MGRGKSFNHKRKGHENKKPKYAENMRPKNTEEVEYAIEPVASYGNKAVSIKAKKD